MTKTASLLDSIQTGVTELPPRVLVYGPEKIGKSTFAAGSSSPIFIPTEDGVDQIGVARFPQATCYDDVKSYIETLGQEEHDYGTVVVDSLDWLERLIWDHLCTQEQVDSIEKVAGGYGKGYKFALTYWREFLNGLNWLRNEREMAVVLIAHSEIKKFEDPELPPYDRYSPRLHKDAAAIICEWCDAVLFASLRTRTKTEKSGFGKERTTAHAVGKDGGDRVIRPFGGPSCVAGNRFGLTKELPLDWAAFVDAIAGRVASKETTTEADSNG